MDDSELQTRFPNMRRIQSVPWLGTIAGFGLDLYGGRDYDEDTHTCIKVRCVSILGIPVIALDAYRVAVLPRGIFFLGREQLSGRAKIFNCIVLLLAFGLGGYAGWHYYTSSPGYAAGQMLAEADRQAASGNLRQAAALYRDVAIGGTGQAPRAEERFKELLAGPLREAEAKDAAAVLQIAVEMRQRPGKAAAADEIFNRGIELIDKRKAQDPRGAYQILQAIAPVGKDAGQLATLRRQLLEGAVARDPSDPDSASNLAVLYEEQGDLKKCDSLLTPHAARLGDREGARILGHLLAEKGNIDQASAHLQTYIDSRLARLHAAEKAYTEVVTAAQQRLVEEVQSGTASQFPYTRFQTAPQNEREEILQKYADTRLRADHGIKAAQEALARETKVVPAALELGMLLLGRARSLAHPGESRGDLERAEKTFLAVRGLAGETDEYRLNLAQVYYWLGKHREGRKLFDEVLAARSGQTETALHVGRLLREVGDLSAARAIIEQAYQKATDSRLKYEAAVDRAVLELDLDDEILWLGRGDPANGTVKAMLSAAKGRRAIRQGKDDEAVTLLREALAAYDRLPESWAMLNNSALICQSLYELSGDRRDLAQLVKRMEKALALNPSNALLLRNTADAIFQSGVREVIGDAIDLGRLRSTGDLSLLYYLCPDAKSRVRIGDRLAANPEVRKARAYYEQSLILTPKNGHSYSSLSSLFAFTENRKELRGLLQKLEGVDLDLADDKRQTLEYYAGAKDSQYREGLASGIKRYEAIVGAAPVKRDATSAVAASSLAAYRMQGDELGMPADVDAVVRLAEEAHTAVPSEGTYFILEEALSFRLVRALRRQDPAFARMLTRAKRSPHAMTALAIDLLDNPSRSEGVQSNPDFKRLLQLVVEYDSKFPEHPALTCWAILQAGGRSEAAGMAARIVKDELSESSRAISLKVSPFDVSAALKYYWYCKLAGKDAAGRSVLKRLGEQGIPLPVELK
jgi:hypothetical protein